MNNLYKQQQNDHIQDYEQDFSDAKYEEKFKYFETLCTNEDIDEIEQYNSVSKRSIPIQSLNLTMAEVPNFQKTLDQNIFNDLQPLDNFALQKLYSTQIQDKPLVEDKIFAKPKKIKAKEKKEQILSLDEEEDESEHPFDESFSSGSDFYEKMSYTDKSKVDPSQQQIQKPEIYSEVMHYKSNILKHQYPEYYEQKKQKELEEEEEQMKEDLREQNIDPESDGSYEEPQESDQEDEDYITNSLIDKFENYDDNFDENSENFINQFRIQNQFQFIMKIIFLVVFTLLKCQDQIQKEVQQVNFEKQNKEKLLGKPQIINGLICKEKLIQAFKNYNLSFSNEVEFIVLKCERNNWGRFNFVMNLRINNKLCTATVYYENSQYKIDLEPLYQNQCFVSVRSTLSN